MPGGPVCTTSTENECTRLSITERPFYFGVWWSICYIAWRMMRAAPLQSINSLWKLWPILMRQTDRMEDTGNSVYLLTNPNDACGVAAAVGEKAYP